MSAHVHDQLSAYLDDELVPGERAVFEAHLKDCALCARELEELAAVDRLARTLPAEAPEAYFEAFAARVRARIAGTPTARRLWRMPAWTLAAAAAVALAVVTPLLLREKPAPAPMSEAPRQPAALPEAPAQPAPQGRAAELDQAQAPAATLRIQKPRRAVPESAELRDEAKSAQDAVKREPAAELGFAQTPPADAVAAKLPAPPATPAPQAAAKARERKKDAAETMIGKLESERTATNAALPPAPAAAPAAADVESRFRSLLGKKATSAAEARALREEWRAVAEKSMGSEADEARVRTIEAGVVAYGLAHDAADLARLRSDAAGYYQRPDAAQLERVRALLRSVGAE